jgi:hypothetical protein
MDINIILITRQFGMHLQMIRVGYGNQPCLLGKAISAQYTAQQQSY